MLRELNTIASDLLGLHGYPLQPIAWGGIFGERVRNDTTNTTVQRSTNVPARPAGKSSSSTSARFGARSHA